MTSSSTNTWAWGHRPLLTTARILAVALVILFHVGAIDHGYVGVDFFFVLSGFLITNVLLDQVGGDRPGSQVLKRFYIRRVKRLAPAALLVLLVTLVVGHFLLPEIGRENLFGTVVAATVFLTNWFFIREDGDYFDTNLELNPLLHYWSLAVEEQFYFVFPVVVIAIAGLARRRRVSASKLLSMGAGLFTIGVAARNIIDTDMTAGRYYYGTDTRSFQLTAGVCLAAALRNRGRIPAGARFFVAPALVGLCAVSVTGSSSVQLTGVLAALASVLLLAGLEATSLEGSIVKRFATPQAQYLGDLSYGVYLIHYPLIVMLRSQYELSTWAMLGIVAPSSYVLAAAMHTLLEAPIRARSVSSIPRVLGPLVGVSLLAVALAAGLYRTPDTTVVAEVAQRPVEALATTGKPIVIDASVFPTQRSEQKAAMAPYPFNACWKDNADCYRSGPVGAPVLTLVGNSFSHRMYPMIEEFALDNGYRFEPAGASATTFIESYCEDECKRRQAALRPAIIASRPRIVIAHASDVLQVPEGADVQALAEQTVDFYTTELGAALIIIESTPTELTMPGWDDSRKLCLENAVLSDECDFTFDRSQFESAPIFKDIAAANPRVAYLDLFDLLCDTESVCASMQPTGFATYTFDGAHVGYHTWEYLKLEVFERLQSTGFVDSP